MNMTETIDGIEFSVAPFQAVPALKLKSYLLGTFGPAIGQTIGVFKDVLKKGADVQINGDALSGAIEKLMAQLDEDSFINLIKRLLANVVAKGEKEGKGFARQFDEKNFEASMDVVFSGRLFSVYPVMGLVLKANYPDFFEKTVRNIGTLIREMSSTEPGSESATEGSGNSGT